MKKILILGLFITFSIFLKAQSLDLSNFELAAHYELSSNLDDVTGNYDTIMYNNPIYQFGGAKSKGCTSFGPPFGNPLLGIDTCVILTPNIDELNDTVFAIQVDFRLSEYGIPIIAGGVYNRFISVQIGTNGDFYILKNSTLIGTRNDLNIQLDEWYNLAIIYNTTDSILQTYLAEELVFTKKIDLGKSFNDSRISNADFGSLQTLSGYLKDLKVYSTDSIYLTAIEEDTTDNNVSINDLNNNYNKNISVFPNPANNIISFDLVENEDFTYQIFDVNGRTIEQSSLKNNSLSISNLQKGIYTIVISLEGYIKGKSRFVKN